MSATDETWSFLFDFDGTIIDSFADLEHCTNDTLRDLGMKIGGEDGHRVALPGSIPSSNQMFFGVGDVEEALARHLVMLSRGMMLGLDRERFRGLDHLVEATRGMVGLAEGLRVLHSSREGKK